MAKQDSVEWFRVKWEQDGSITGEWILHGRGEKSLAAWLFKHGMINFTMLKWNISEPNFLVKNLFSCQSNFKFVYL